MAEPARRGGTEPVSTVVPSILHEARAQPPVRHTLHLHRAISNQVVQRLVNANADGLVVGSADNATAHFGHDFSRIPVYAKASAEIQTKLTVAAPGDLCEQEADRVADQVTRMPGPATGQWQLIGNAYEQQADSLGERVLQCPNGPAPRITTANRAQLQLKCNAAMPDESNHVPQVVHAALNTPGRPLPPAVLAFAEPRFDADFSHVRIHDDSLAATSARAVNALAYTAGRDIVFDSGQYSPETFDGRKLISHELTHVLQSAGPAAPAGRSNPSASHAPATVGSADDPLEVQADQAAEAVSSGGALATIAMSRASVAEQQPLRRKEVPKERLAEGQIVEAAKEKGFRLQSGPGSGDGGWVFLGARLRITGQQGDPSTEMFIYRVQLIENGPQTTDNGPIPPASGGANGVANPHWLKPVATAPLKSNAAAPLFTPKITASALGLLPPSPAKDTYRYPWGDADPLDPLSATGPSKASGGAGVAAPPVLGELFGQMVREGPFPRTPLEREVHEGLTGAVASASEAYTELKQKASEIIPKLKQKGYQLLIDQLQGLKESALASLKKGSAKLPPKGQRFAEACIDVVGVVADLHIKLLLYIVSNTVGGAEAVVGMVTGVPGMVTGIVKLAYGVIKVFVDYALGIFDNFDHFNKDKVAIKEGFDTILKKLTAIFNNWSLRWKEASNDKKVIMIGELTGEVGAFLVTLGLGGAKAGQVPKLRMIETADAAALERGEAAMSKAEVTSGSASKAETTAAHASDLEAAKSEGVPAPETVAKPNVEVPVEPAVAPKVETPPKQPSAATKPKLEEPAPAAKPVPALAEVEGAAFGKQMAQEMKAAGYKGNEFREFGRRLNALSPRLSQQEAAKAIVTGLREWAPKTMGTMPPVWEGDVLVVPSRAPIPNAPIMGIKSDGTVYMGRVEELVRVTDPPPGHAVLKGKVTWEDAASSAGKTGEPTAQPAKPPGPFAELSTGKSGAVLAGKSVSVGEAAEALIIKTNYSDANILPPKYQAFDAVRGGVRKYVQKWELYKGRSINVVEETVEGGEWISIKTLEAQTATPEGIDRVVLNAVKDIANKRGAIRDPIPYGDAYLRVMPATPDSIILHIQSPKSVTKELRAAAEKAAAFYSEGLGLPRIKVVVAGP
jgi:hypothetical protein